MAQRNRSGGGRRRRGGGDEGPDLFAQHLASVVEKAFTDSAAIATTEATPLQTQPEETPPPLGATSEAAVGLVEIQADEVEAPDAAAATTEDEAPAAEAQEEPLPARMLNEFVYCPRLFYYEHVEGVFVESADTVKGAAVHARVDKGKGELPQGVAAAGQSEAGEASAQLAADETPPASEEPGARNVARTTKKRRGKAAPEEAEEIHSRSVTLGSERLGVIAKMDLVEAFLALSLIHI